VVIRVMEIPLRSLPGLDSACLLNLIWIIVELFILSCFGIVVCLGYCKD